MINYICGLCGFLYDVESAEQNVEGEVIPFHDLPEIEPEWTCPNCGGNMEFFRPVEREEKNEPTVDPNQLKNP